ncbi:MAG: hypothetical protein N3G22_02185 [Candidatus Micrarchaeota archaeon]|nr:hypothetical protein [Candidatus Micrarchaeota archaeon]
MAKGKSKTGFKRKVAPSQRKRRKKPLPVPKLKEETFTFERPAVSEFSEQRIAPPEEELAPSPPPLPHEPDEQPSKRHLPLQHHYGKAVRKSLFLRLLAVFGVSAIGAGLFLVFLAVFLHMELLHSLLISGSLFIAFLIVTYTLFDPGR